MLDEPRALLARALFPLDPPEPPPKAPELRDPPPPEVLRLPTRSPPPLLLLAPAPRFPASLPELRSLAEHHADAMRQRWNAVDVRCTDFLACNGDLGKFDRILMNPPFADGADIKHIEHAIGFLKPAAGW